jgi:hypothetical protein
MEAEYATVVKLLAEEEAEEGEVRAAMTVIPTAMR